MKNIIILLFVTLPIICLAKTIQVHNINTLYKALNSPVTELHLVLHPGTYDLKATNAIDTSLGNALKPDSSITVTTGLHIKGKSVILEGENREKTIIKTNAGYGIFIEDCKSVTIRNLTVTGGTRDAEGNATSAAIVVKHSNVEIANCIIQGNQGDFSKTIAGIIGIAGREGSILNIHNNIIHDNSWDGIALYRGASAVIHDNLIYNGRGAGIGVTWDANALVYRNVIHQYWKGIGSFGTSRVTVCNNLVRDLRGWGIIASGESKMTVRYNEVRRMGNVGMVVWDSTATMNISDNIISQSGTESQWVAPLVGLWIMNYEGHYSIERNLFTGNKEADIGVGLVDKPEETPSFTFAVKWVNAKDEKNYFTSLDSVSVNTNYLPLDKTTWKGDSGVLNRDGTKGRIGIFGGWYGNWDWDPDKEPF
jgi:hypothetical protein